MSTPTSTPSPQTFYFAYGSNLSLAQMQTRCPDSTYIGTGVLQNYRWIVNQRGYANIIFCGDSGVDSKSDCDSESVEEEGIRDGQDVQNENGTGNPNTNKNSSTSPPRHAEETAVKLLSPPSPNTVYGLLYTLSHRDETLLDINEGVPFAYTKTHPLITLLSVSPTLDAPTISCLLSLFPGPGSVSGVEGSSARSALAFPFPFPLPLSSPSASPSTPSQILLSSPPTATTATSSSSQSSQPAQQPTPSSQKHPPPPLQIRALTYIDTQRITPSAPNPEYITRMNRGIRDALSKGFPPSYVRDVMRVYIPASEEGGDF